MIPRPLAQVSPFLTTAKDPTYFISYVHVKRNAILFKLKINNMMDVCCLCVCSWAVQEFRSPGVQGHGSPGVQEPRNPRARAQDSKSPRIKMPGVQAPGIQDSSSPGAQDSRILGVKESRTPGAKGSRSPGVQEHEPRSPGVQKSKKIQTSRSANTLSRSKSPGVQDSRSPRKFKRPGVQYMQESNHP
jgi:hypothetical protein